jgi:iron complex transport system substrate-binding protein
MKRRLAAALVASTLWTSDAGATMPIEVSDDAGHRAQLPAPAQRVVALGPHLAEMLHAVGGGDRLVGVLRHSDFPEAVRRVPSVGDAHAVNHEAIAALKPDLVLVWGSGINERHKARLRSLGVPVFESEIRDVDGIARTLRMLGTLVGTAPTAETAARAVETRWRRLRERHAGRTPVRVFYQVWHEPLMTINGEHVISQAISACGGVNPFANLPGLTPTIGWEAAVRADPQLVVRAGTPADAGPAKAFARWPDFAHVQAVRHGRFAVIDGDLIARMGPRFLDGAQALCEAIESAR